MAGITNAPFRQVCAEFATLPTAEAKNGASGSEVVIPGLFVNEMVAARKLENSERKAREYLSFAASEQLRSAQIYCTDPEEAAGATRMIVQNDLADHIDLNFGCPAKKVTQLGGGCAVPLNPDLYREVVRAVVGETSVANPRLAVTAKFRIGLNPGRETWQDAARIAVEEGARALTLHARFAEQYYSGAADWSYIKRLTEFVKQDLQSDVAVFGNGDVFSAEDAARMLQETGADGVTIGRGVVGRPWLFRELLTGECPISTFADVRTVIAHHLDLAVAHTAAAEGRSERRAVEDFRVYIGPYLKGFAISGTTKRRLLTASSRARFDEILYAIDPELPFDQELAKRPRVKTGGEGKIWLPNQ
jgi:nifR3 family TIM-barrel protein